MTPCPSIGKKKAKGFAQQTAATKRMEVQLPFPLSHSTNIASNVSLERLALAAKAMNEVGKCMASAVKLKTELPRSWLMKQAGIAKEQLMMQVFLAYPQSVALIAFSAKFSVYSALEVRPVVMMMTNIPVSPANFLKDKSDFGLLPDTQKLDAAAAALTYDDEDITC
ncbi:hypothetical protein MHU86_20083 [Fragilaria crotonensis]|nr:hypothetical protein MHU86_20083 [Fragilaria crotonensis]